LEQVLKSFTAFFGKHPNQDTTMPFLKKICDRVPFLRDTKSTTNTPPTLPAFTPSQLAQLQRVPNYTPIIKASDVPQWLWTNAQCKDWLFAVCHVSLGLTGEEAKAITAKFDGCGPVIYMMEYVDWIKLLGTQNRAQSVYAYVVNTQHEPGAIPDGVVLKRTGLRGNNKRNSMGWN
jgi:hypothetical protein